MDNTLEQLARYIDQELQRGESEQSVRDSLVQNGWTQKAIDGAFGIMQYHQSHPTLPLPMGSGIPDPQVTVDQPVAPARPTGGPLPQPQSQIQPQPLPNAQNPSQPSITPYTPPKQPRKGGAKTLLLSLLVLVIVGFIGAAAWIVVSKNKQDKPTSKALPTEQQKLTPMDKDAERKSDINIILANLTDYYIKHQTYPTLAQVQDVHFIGDNRFKSDAFKDPDWNKQNEACTSAEGKPMLSLKADKNCYAYAISTDDGKPCDAGATPCTRIIVTAFTSDGKPYSVGLTRNANSTINQ